MALLFPSILLLIMLLAFSGIWYSHRVLVQSAAEEAMTLYALGAAQNEPAARLAAEEYLALELSALEEDNLRWWWEEGGSWLRPSAALSLEGSYSQLVTLPYHVRLTRQRTDARRFRDRTDLLLEKLKTQESAE